MPQDGATMSKVGINFDPVDMTKDHWDLTDYKDSSLDDSKKKYGTNSK